MPAKGYAGFWACLIVMMVVQVVVGDVYLHNPRGSNDRNCEKDVNRKNANRLFDSQNNAKGGYACPYPANNQMYYHSGSTLKLEWTLQHGCGNGKTKCDVVLQYMCGENVRDGVPTANNNEGTNRIPEEASANTDTSFGMHENFEYYQEGLQRERNKGLWTADRWIGSDRGATQTRQNNNGERFGFEIPEERDYYPYWHASPWIDIAIYTDFTSKCTYYQSESFNVKPRGRCVRVPGTEKTIVVKQGAWPNNQQACEKLNQTWTTVPALGYPAPDCRPLPVSRENQLGNVAVPRGPPEPFYHDWTIPNVEKDQKCVFRVRYNISVGDFNGHGGGPEEFVDFKFNGKEKSPVVQDPYVSYSGNTLSLKINTNQIGRTFQDRSYVFRIVPRPSSVASDAKIFNLNVRGKRGNIVQVYPAVEYDFIPNRITAKPNDVVHIQWVGSDYNPQRGPNDAEGGPPTVGEDINQNARADRSNLVEVLVPNKNVPLNTTQLESLTMFRKADGSADMDLIRKLSFLGQTDCLSLKELLDDKNKRAKERDPRNCAKINTKSPYFDGGLVVLRKQGSFYYMCTRNNNFSNRDQKGQIIVGNGKRSVEQEGGGGLPTNLVPGEGNSSVDNPPVDEQEAYINSRRNGVPYQFKDNDAGGAGWGKWMSTVNQANSAILLESLFGDDENDRPGKSGVSPGALVGMAFAGALGGLLIGAAVTAVIYRYKHKN